MNDLRPHTRAPAPFFSTTQPNRPPHPPSLTHDKFSLFRFFFPPFCYFPFAWHFILFVFVFVFVFLFSFSFSFFNLLLMFFLNLFCCWHSAHIIYTYTYLYTYVFMYLRVYVFCTNMHCYRITLNSCG